MYAAPLDKLTLGVLRTAGAPNNTFLHRHLSDPCFPWSSFAGAEVYAYGSYALKTYLPDADLDVSAFFSKSMSQTWCQRIVGALCQEANSQTDISFAVRSVSFINADVRVVKAQVRAANRC